MIPFGDPKRTFYRDGAESRALHKVVGGLPPRQREAITLLKLQELFLKEDTVPGPSGGSLTVATHRGMTNLKQLLPKQSKDA